MKANADFEEAIALILNTTGRIPTPEEMDGLAAMIQDINADHAQDARDFATYLRQRKLN